MRLSFVARTAPAALLLLVGLATLPAYASSVLSVQTGDVLSESRLLMGLPDGALILKDDEVGQLEKQTRTLTCEDIHGGARTGVTMEGGPIIEHRFQAGFEQDSLGNTVLDTHGRPKKKYSTWLRAAGQCLRHHSYVRTSTPCPEGLVGVITERRSYTQTDDNTLVDDTGWVEISRTCETNQGRAAAHME